MGKIFALAGKFSNLKVWRSNLKVKAKPEQIAMRKC
jgi:hypothetical protein